MRTISYRIYCDFIIDNIYQYGYYVPIPPIGIVGVRMRGFIEKLEELLELGGTKRDLKRPCIAFH